MSGITLDFGDIPSVLNALRNPANDQLMANAAAQSYTDDTLNWIAAGHSFTPRSGGGLEQSIGWLPLGGGRSEVYANQDYALYVEEGTRPHVISPKPGRKGLKIPVGGGGGFIIRRQVNHPGTRPMPFFFADMEARKAHMHAAGLSVLARAMANA